MVISLCINPVNHNNPVYTTSPKVILSTQLCHLICYQSPDFAEFDRIINIENLPSKYYKSLETKAFSHT